jgi:hypothetical protein
MPTLREMLPPRRDIERRAVGRTTINRDVSMFFTGKRQRMLYSRCHEPWCRSQIEWPEHRAFGIRHLVRQFPHNAPLPTDLARWRLCRRGVRNLVSSELQ